MGVNVSQPAGAGTITETPTTLQSAAVATGNGTIISLNPGDVLTIKTVGASTPTATITFEVSYDGTNYVNAFLQDMLAAGGIGTLINTVAVSTTPAYSQYSCPPGSQKFRARISAYVAGSVTVTVVQRSRA